MTVSGNYGKETPRTAPAALFAGAQFDATRSYRYHLWREWQPALPRLAFVMLNPSTADSNRDDATIRRCQAFARRWGFGALDVVNLFGYRATHPRALYAAQDPVGPDNDAFLVQVARRADMLLLAWGNHGGYRNRAAEVLALLAPRGPLYTLGLTRRGHPRHPLYLSGDLSPTRFST